MGDMIKKSVLYYSSAREIWAHLEKRYTVSNGSLKYKLNKAVYETRQDGMPINEYYKKLSVLWEQIENLSGLPPITQITPEVQAFVDAVKQQQEEQHLFQFLNGLDEDYREANTGGEKSAMNNKIVKIQPEKSGSQKKMLYDEPCEICGRRNHITKDCWYGKGNPKAKASGEDESNPTIAALTPQVIKQLLSIASSSNAGQKLNSDNEEDLETPFSGMIAYCNAVFQSNTWILDSGASDHMISEKSELMNMKEVKNYPTIKLPNGKYAEITHVGDIRLNNMMTLKRVVYVPDFKQNLLSINKLSNDENLKVLFYPDFCVIQDLHSKKIKGLGRVHNGLYYLVNIPLE
ncbi:Retrovirus-related Pol polyprotein from transposon RE2 [Bienertia sinuspersici]